MKVKSELDAAFEVILDEAISITCVELIPYSVNTTASIVLLKGGEKHHFVKIKLQSQPAASFSFFFLVHLDTNRFCK